MAKKIKLNLKKIGAKIEEKNGKKYITFRFDERYMFIGKKGIYLDLIFFPTPNSDFSTHLIKPSVKKNENGEYPETPIIGNILKDNRQTQEADNQTDNFDNTDFDEAGDDDLPF